MKNAKIEGYLERFLKDGGESLSDKEYFELLMSYSGMSDAEKLYEEYGSFKSVIDADTEYLINAGTNLSTAVLLKIISAMSKVYQCDFNTISSIKTSEKARCFFSQLFRGAKNENFVIVSVSDKFKIEAVSNVIKGNMMSVNASYRMMADFIVKNNAERVFISHNHPIGKADASKSDLIFTEEMISFLNNLGTVMIDHIIIGMDDSLSMRESGQCSALNEQSDLGYKYHSVN